MSFKPIDREDAVRREKIKNNTKLHKTKKKKKKRRTSEDQEDDDN